MELLFKRYCLLWIYQLLQLIAITTGTRQNYVTCGSVFKLYNSDSEVRLHSHDVKYGTGSGQQSVTGTKQQEDVNSHWALKAATKETCARGEKIKCNSIVRLEHLASGKNLHSHDFLSPLSGNQEISCFGESGEGNVSDDWNVMCSGEYWIRDEDVQLQHVVTKKYLAVSIHTFGTPIRGQKEIVGVPNLSKSANWQASEGIFLHATELQESAHIHAHTEL